MAIGVKKGTAPGAGRVRASEGRPDATTVMLAKLNERAAEVLPDEETMAAIERAPAVRTGAGADGAALVPAGAAGDEASAAPGSTGGTPREAPREARGEAGREAGATADGEGTLLELPIAEIRRSPFQPVGRPSAAVVRELEEAIATVGSLETLVNQEGVTHFQRLSGEGKRLAELAYSIAQHGVETRIEVRTNEAGETEALSGHRRLAAAALAGRATVPVLHRGAVDALRAASMVLRGNLHREDWSPWQEAELVHEVQRKRQEDGLPATVRVIGTLMGYAHSKAHGLLTIRRQITDAVIAAVGPAEAVREALSRCDNVQALLVAAREPEVKQRTARLRALLGIAAAEAPAQGQRAAVQVATRRSGGFSIDCRVALHRLSVSDAEALLAGLEAKAGEVRAHLARAGGS